MRKLTTLLVVASLFFGNSAVAQVNEDELAELLSLIHI